MRARRASSSLVVSGLALLVLLAWPTPSRADMRCASRVVVHEWGVHVYGHNGLPLSPVALPPWFHTRLAPTSPSTPVKQLPVDSGIRLLPVLHFYAQTVASTRIPIGVEVAFKSGQPGVWYPGVDRIEPPERSEEGETSMGGVGRRPTPIDQGRLVWDRLELSPTPRGTPVPSDLDWVGAARGLSALWVERPFESERFVFYEAATQERVPLVLRRGRAWTRARREMVIENNGRHKVHDVFFVHREGERAFVFRVHDIAPQVAISFTIEDHPLTIDLRQTLHELLDEAPPSADSPRECVSGRNPAEPVQRAGGHRLYKDEVDLILRVWGQRFFDTPGTSILYREGTPQLDEVMPLSIYTDMYHFIELRRAGLALWQGLSL